VGDVKLCSVEEKTMKKFSFIIVTALCIYSLVLGTVLYVGEHHHSATNPITAERKATHMITYYDDKDSEHRISFCTGTAVGPHALLTAMHCDFGESSTISLDLSVKKYHIIGTARDGRDHIIYHLDGPAFTNVVTIKERKAIMGEQVISYGNGKEDYPPHTYVGKVVEQANGGDTSEVDAADDTTEFTLPVVPGDSGSAVYAKDGSIVALVTYEDEDEETATHRAVGFALAFTAEQLDIIAQPDDAPEHQ
jgi:hypothetical protein